MRITQSLLAASIVAVQPSLSAAQLSPVEKKLADAIDCKFFKKNLDGSWTGGPDAKIGKIMAGGLTFVRGGFKIDGADFVTALDQKCGRKF